MQMQQMQYMNAPPDIQAGASQLFQQQKLAELLRQQASTPIQADEYTKSGSGQWAAPPQIVKVGLGQGLAKLAEGGIGGYMENKVGEDQLALANQLRTRRQTEIGNILSARDGKPATQGSDTVPGYYTYNTDGTGMASTNDDGTPQGMQYIPPKDAVPAQAAVPPATNKQIAGMLINSDFPDLQKVGETQLFTPKKADVHSVSEGGKLVQINEDGTNKVIAEGDPKRIPPLFKEVYVNGPKGEPMVQKMISSDNGVTWKNEGDTSPRFAKQVAPIINVGDQAEPLTEFGQKAADDLISNGKPLPGGFSKSAISRGNAALNRIGEKIYGAGGSNIPLSEQQNEGVAAKATEIKFTSGDQSNIIRFLRTTNSHADLVGELLALQQNGEINVPNRIRAKYREETGSELPTNAKLAVDVLGKETVKALGVMGAGTAEERDAIAKGLQLNGSPTAQTGAIRTLRSLLGGQIQGLANQYKIGTRKNDFYTRFGFTPEGNVIPSKTPPPAPAGVNGIPTGQPPPAAGAMSLADYLKSKGL
jgi:hypothetical protein